MIEVSIAHDKRLNKLSDFAQLLYLKILPHTDDWGRFEGDPEVVKGRVDPLSHRPASRYETAMREISEARLWLWYETDKGKMVVQFNEDAFERINAFLIKSRKNPEYPPHKDSYRLICGVMGAITHKEQQAESKEIKVESKKQRDKPENLEEAQTYFRERGDEAEASVWWDHFEGNGWRVGKPPGTPMKNWQATVRTWLHNKKKWGNNGTGHRTGNSGNGREVFTNATIDRLVKHPPGTS
jgi:hypothetical protein